MPVVVSVSFKPDILQKREIESVRHNLESPPLMKNDLNSNSSSLVHIAILLHFNRIENVKIRNPHPLKTQVQMILLKVMVCLKRESWWNFFLGFSVAMKKGK